MRQVMLLILFSFALSSTVFSSTMPPLKQVNETINFKDDLDFEFMLKAIVRQEKYFNHRNPNEVIHFGNRTIKRVHLRSSLLAFKSEVTKAIECFEIKSKSKCDKAFNIAITNKFDVYKPIPESWEQGFKKNKTLFTAYYSPDFEGSFTRTEEFNTPIYGKPEPSLAQKYTSDEINYGGKLDGMDLEVFYVKQSLYDVWLLHVEGGGRVKVKQTDGSYKIFYLSYDGSNKKSFNMLYKYMFEKGMIKKGQSTIALQRKYFVSHPEDQRAILNSCPSYIYFKITESEPLGVHDIPLTEQRSLASDYRRIKEYGIIHFIQTKKPVIADGKVTKVNFSRFFINQDTGGAIKGNARSDLYFGYGDKAELAANHVYGLGKQYYIILK